MKRIVASVLLMAALTIMPMAVSAKTNFNIVECDSAIEMSKKMANADSEDIFAEAIISDETILVDGEEADSIGDFVDMEEINSIEEDQEKIDFLEERYLEAEMTEDGDIRVTAPYQSKRLILFASDLSDDYGAKRVLLYKGTGEYVLEFDSYQETKKAYERMSSIYGKAVLRDEINTISSYSKTNGVYSWGFNAMGMDDQTSRQFVCKSSDGYKSVTVAVIDTGIATEQVKKVFPGRIIRGDGYDFVNNDDDPADDNGHGSHCAGTVLDGTFDNVEIVVFKVLNDKGSGLDSRIINSYNRIIDMNTDDDPTNDIDVINASYGGGGEPPEVVLKKLRELGVVFCAAAGNDAENVNTMSPAKSAYTYAVSAIDEAFSLASFSNYGKEIDFAAPGTSIVSVAYNKSGELPLTGMEGTSMATPHVAAAFANLKTFYPDYSVEELAEVAKRSAIDFGKKGKDDDYGYGMINLYDPDCLDESASARHDFIATYTWNDSFSECALSLECKDCSKTISSLSMEIESTISKDYYVVHQASLKYGGTKYTDKKSLSTATNTWDISDDGDIKAYYFDSIKELVIAGNGTAKAFDENSIPWIDEDIEHVFVSGTIGGSADYWFRNNDEIIVADLSEMDATGLTSATEMFGTNVHRIEMPKAMGSISISLGTDYYAVDQDSGFMTENEVSAIQASNINTKSISGRQSIHNWRYREESGDDVTLACDECKVLKTGNMNEVNEGKLTQKLNSAGTVVATLYTEAGYLTIEGDGEIDARIEYLWRYTQYVNTVEKLKISGRITGNCAGMFRDMGILEVADFSDWDTSGVTSTSYMFYGDRNLKEVKLADKSFKNVLYTNGMFNGCRCLKTINTGFLASGCVTHMSQMFYNCKELEYIDLSGCDFSEVVDMDGAFSECQMAKRIILPKTKTTKLRMATALFAGCSSLKNLDVTSIDTSHVSYFTQMFCRCENLMALDVSGFNTSGAVIMSEMFYKCRSLKKLDLSTFDTSLVTKASGMFGFCENLEVLDISSFNMSVMSEVSNMLLNLKCHMIVTPKKTAINDIELSNAYYEYKDNSIGKSSTEKIEKDTEGSKIYVLPFNSHKWNKTDNENEYKCLVCGIIDTNESYKAVYKKYDISESKDGSVLATLNLNSGRLEISGSGTIKSFASNDWGSYYNRITYASIAGEIDGDFRYIFYNNGNLRSVDLSDWRPKNAVGMYEAFSGCTNLNSIDFGDGIKGINDVRLMFKGCQRLSTVDFGDIEFSQVDSTEEMFNGCCSLSEINLPKSLSVISDSTFAGTDYLEKVYIKNYTCSISDNNTFSPTAVIYSEQGSTAQAFATANNYKFIVVHDLVHHDAYSGDCCHEGNVEYWYCEHCDKYFEGDNGQTELTRDNVFFKVPHSLTHHDAIESDCITQGNLEYWKCGNCSRYFSDEGANTELTETEVFYGYGDHKLSDDGRCTICSRTSVNPEDGAVVSIEVGEYSYTGYAISPQISVEVNQAALTEGVDYTLTCDAKADAGSYTFEIAGINDYIGTATGSWSIERVTPDIGDVFQSAAIAQGTLRTDAELIRSDATTPGSLRLKDVAGEFAAGEYELEWIFIPDDTVNYNCVDGTVLITVAEVKPAPKYLVKEGSLAKNVYQHRDKIDLTGLTFYVKYSDGSKYRVSQENLTYSSTLKKGQTYVTVKIVRDKKSLTTKVTGLKVGRRKIDVSGLSFETNSFRYDGTAKSVNLIGTVLNGVKVTVSGNKRVYSGTYTAKASFTLAKGYSSTYYVITGGPVTGTWSITGEPLECETLVNKVYGDPAFRLNVMNAEGKITYTSSNTNIATVDKTGLIKIRGAGVVRIKVSAHNGYVNTRIIVVPKAPSLNSAASTSATKITTKWTRDSRAKGYTIEYSKDENFETEEEIITKTVTASKAGTKPTYTIAGLESGETYYVRMRSYTLSGTVRYYGDYSRVIECVIR